jgi:hypothetical protein
MKRRDRYSQRQCWMDLFEGDEFMGRMQRIFGPAELKGLKGKSAIVGPKAQVLLEVRRGGKPAVVRLDANRLIPSFAAKVRGAMIRTVKVVKASPSAPRADRGAKRRT